MIVAAALLIAASGAWPLHRVTTFASAPRTCTVLQAAYTASVGGPQPLVPPDVRMSPTRVLELNRFVPAARAASGLSPGEFAALTTRAPLYRADRFRPVCRWRGKKGPAGDGELHQIWVSFTSPIFTGDGRTALVEVSTREDGFFGYGSLCTVRLRGRRWAAICMPSWIA